VSSQAGYMDAHLRPGESCPVRAGNLGREPHRRSSSPDLHSRGLVKKYSTGNGKTLIEENMMIGTGSHLGNSLLCYLPTVIYCLCI